MIPDVKYRKIHASVYVYKYSIVLAIISAPPGVASFRDERIYARFRTISIGIETIERFQPS